MSAYEGSDVVAYLYCGAQCPSISPESRSRCVLPDTREAHYKGHESAIVDCVRACWNTRQVDEQRWDGVPQ